MKRVYIIIAATLLATGVQAQGNQLSNYMGVNIGAGMNTIMYNPNNGSHYNGLGFGASLQYAHFFGKHLGFSVGAQYATYNASAKYNQKIAGHDTIHPDNGLQYTPITVYNNWRERQTINVLSIPVEVLLRAQIGESWAFLLGLGAQFDMPVGAKYSANAGTFENRGYFPLTNVEYSNLPEFGFHPWNASEVPDGDIDVNKKGVSVIADLGCNHWLGDNWGYYFGIYGSYGVSNLYDDANANNDMLRISSSDASQLEYNSTIASDRVNKYNLFSAGVKLGLNLGWDCKHGMSGDGDIVPYAPTPDKNAEYGAERTAAERAAAEKAKAEKLAAERAAAQAAEAARHAQYATDAALAEAMRNIDADLTAAEELANQSGNNTAKSDVNKAKAKAQQAKEAYNNGKFADANTLMKEAYALLANSYSADADTFANNGGDREAANNASTYAKAANNGDLAVAMAAMRNARINALRAKDGIDKEKKSDVMSDVKTDVKTEVTNGTNDNTKLKQTDRANLVKYFNQINTGIHFDFNKSEVIAGTGIDFVLKSVATVMAADKSITITCIGHTDSIGTEEYNMALGLRRAKALKALLVKYGAPIQNISTKSRGENEPVAPNDTKENRAKNRRAVIEQNK